MAGEAGLFCLHFAFNGKEPPVVIILGEGSSCFLWCLEEKNENANTENDECHIYQEYLFLISFLHESTLLILPPMMINGPFRCG